MDGWWLFKKTLLNNSKPLILLNLSEKKPKETTISED